MVLIDTVFCLSLICMPDLKNFKNINFLHVAMETPKLTWYNLFGHQSTQSAILG